MTGALLLIFGLIGCWLLGVGTVRLVDGCRSECGTRLCRPAAETAGLGIVLGIGLTSWLLLICSLCGFSLGRPLSIVLASVGWVCGIAAWRCSNRQPVPVTVASPLVRFCQLLVGLLFVNQLVQTLLTPQHLWDERAIYAIKGAVLFEDQTLESPALLDPDFVQYHPRYPLLIPLAEEHVYALLGEVNDRWSKVLFPLMSLGLILTFAGVLTRRCGPDAAWTFAVLLATVPALMFWEYGFLCGQADAPMACYHGVAVLLLWDRLRTFFQHESTGVRAQARGVLLPGVCAGLAIFVKDEAIAYFIVDAALLCLLLAFWSGGRWQSSLVTYVVYLFAVGAVVVPWLLQRRMLPVTGEMTYFHRLGLETLRAGFPALLWSGWHLPRRMFWEAREWGLQWWGVLLSLATAPRRALSPSQLLLLGDLAGALAGLVVAGMIAPTPVEEHIGGSSHRFLMQITPVAVLFIAGQWYARDERAQAR